MNICYSVIGKPFSDFVRERVDARNNELTERNDFNIAVDPEILEVIKTSTAVSTSKGNSAMLLKIGTKRRRTRAEIEEFRSMQERELVERADKDARIRELESQVRESKSKL